MKTIAFIIPVFNEGKRIDKTFAALQRVRLPHGFKLTEIVFINDGSTDRTLIQIKKRLPHIATLLHCYIASEKKSTIKQFNNRTILHVISYPQNKGKGYAIREGLKRATADYSLILDADMSTEPTELAKFVKHMKSGTDLIIGTRKNGRSTVILHQPFVRELLGRGFTTLTKLLLGLKGTDFTCGFKALSPKARTIYVSKGSVDRWGYDAELLYIAAKYRLTTAEVPVIWSNDARTKVRLGNAIVTSLVELARIRLNDLRGVYGNSLFSEPVVKIPGTASSI